MKKRIISLFLVSVLLLSGCAVDPQRDPTETTTGLASLEEYREKVIAAAEVITYDAEPLIEYDPDREVYISLANTDCDFYPTFWISKANLVIITKEHYNVEDIQVNIPMKTEYTLDIKDVTDWCAVPAYRSEQSHYGLQLYQYMCMQGFDWQELGKLQAYVDSAQKLQRQNVGIADKGEENKAYAEIAYMYQEEINQIFAKYEADYQKLSQEEIPQFGAYRIGIKFVASEERTYFDETVEQVEFVIGGKSHKVEIGQWRFHETCPQTLMDSFTRIGLEKETLASTGLNHSPYFGSYTFLGDFFAFTAETDLIVTGIRQFDTDLDVLGAQVTVGKQVSYFWEMDIPIEVKKGEKVEIDLYLRDDRFAKHDVCITSYIIMDYEIRGKAYEMITPCYLLRWDMHCWDSYLMAFEGIDAGPYYACYLDPMNDSWLEELPESWLE